MVGMCGPTSPARTSADSRTSSCTHNCTTLVEQHEGRGALLHREVVLQTTETNNLILTPDCLGYNHRYSDITQYKTSVSQYY